jgi:hypothetical protein
MDTHIYEDGENIKWISKWIKNIMTNECIWLGVGDSGVFLWTWQCCKLIDRPCNFWLLKKGQFDGAGLILLARRNAKEVRPNLGNSCSRVSTKSFFWLAELQSEFEWSTMRMEVRCVPLCQTARFLGNWREYVRLCSRGREEIACTTLCDELRDSCKD